jgi:hypothetical protein
MSAVSQNHLWQPCYMHLLRFLQSASFFTPTLGDELRLLTNNGATNSEPLAHKNTPNSFWAPIGHQPSRSKHRRHSSSEYIPAPGKCWPQHHRAHSARNATASQHLVFNGSAHYSSSLSLHCCQRAGPHCSDGLCCPFAPLAHNISHGLTLP